MEPRRQSDGRVHTLDAAVETYVSRRYASGDWNAVTRNNNRGILKGFSSHYGCRPWNQLGRRAVEEWKENLFAGEYRVSTRYLRQQVVGPFLTWLGREWTYEVVVDGVTQTRQVPDLRAALGKPESFDRVPHPLNEEEVAAVLAAIPDARTGAIIAAELYPGLRRCEIHRMQRGDYDGTWLKVRGKGGRATRRAGGVEEYPDTRTVPVGDECRRAFEAWLDERGRHAGPMFPGRRGDAGLSVFRISQLVDVVMYASGVKKKAGDGKAGHAFRHTCGTDAIDSGQNIFVVQELLGHSSADITKLYYKVNPHHLVGCVNRDYRSVQELTGHRPPHGPRALLPERAAAPSPEGKPRVVGRRRPQAPPATAA